MRASLRFAQYVGSLCARRMKNVYQMGEKIGMEPQELLNMINGKIPITKAALRGLAKELDSDERYLEQMLEKD